MDVSKHELKIFETLCAILYHLYNLKKCEKQPKPATLLKVTLLHKCFLRFLNYANGNK